MGKVENSDAVEISADMATEILVTDRLRTYKRKKKQPTADVPQIGLFFYFT